MYNEKEVICMDSSKEMNCSSEPIPDIITQFEKNNPNTKYDNFYLCESIDMDGNVIDTKIGVNIMTNYGLKSRWVRASYDNNSNFLYLGSGKTKPAYDSTTLTEPISALSGYRTWEGEAVRFPTKYDRSTHLWSMKAKVFEAEWDYTYGNNQEYEIWELGLGTSRTKLRTHSLIYDIDGNQTCIKKKPNTRLHITVFWNVCVNIKRIQEKYDEGKYAYIDLYMLVYSSYYNSNALYMTAIGRGNIYMTNADRYVPTIAYTNLYNGSEKEDDPQQTQLSFSLNSGNGVMWEDKYQYCSGILIAGNQWSYSYNLQELKNLGIFGMLTYDRMTEPEEMESYFIFTDGCNRLICPADANAINDPRLYQLTDIFGSHYRYKKEDGYRWEYRDCFPCTNFNITEVNMYNHITKEYDIQVPFHTSDWDYNEMHWHIHSSLWVKHNGAAKWVYVFINTTPDRIITKFENSAITICATDEYWDPDTYVQIPNLGSVPSSLSHKRYYIITGGSPITLVPVFGNPDYHRIDPVRKPFELTDESHGVPIEYYYDYRNTPSNMKNISSTDFMKAACKPICSNEKRWYSTYSNIVFYNEDDTCTVKPIEMREGYIGCKFRRFKTTSGDKFVIFEHKKNNSNPCKNGLRIFTITDKDTDFTTQDITLEFEDQTDIAGLNEWHYLSWSDNGFLVAQRALISQPHEAVIVDVYGDEESDGQATQYLLTDVFGCTAILLTDNCFYLDTNESVGTKYVFKLYDMKNRTVLKSYELDDNVNYEILAIYGFREFVYVTVKSNGTTSTVFFNTEEDTSEKLAYSLGHIRFDKFEVSCNYTAINDCMIICDLDQRTKIIMANDPVPPNGFLNLYQDTVTTAVSNNNVFPNIATCNEGKQLILALTNLDHLNVVDLGWVLDNGPVKYMPQYAYQTYTHITRYEYKFMSCAYVFNDGIIYSADQCSSAYSEYHRGRQYWMPLDILLPLHMKGTTYTLSAYNQPIKWWGKELTLDITNDMSRMIDDEDVQPTNEVTESG